MSPYKPRIIDSILKRKLRGKGAILIEGPNGVVRQLLRNSFQRASCL